MGTTPNYNIQYPDSGDQWDLINDLQTLADTTDTAIDSILPVSIANGGTGATTAEAARNNLGIGLIPIIPSSYAISVGSASIGLTGYVNFSGVSYIQINNCFNANYKNYKILINIDSATGSGLIQGRIGPVGNTSAVYYFGGTATTQGGLTTGVTGSATNQWDFAYHFNGSGILSTISIDIHNPHTTTRTQFVSQSAAADSGNNFISRSVSGTHVSLTSYTDFTLIGATGSINITGTMQVFAYKV